MSAKTIFVGSYPDCEAASLSQALELASPGDTIAVRPGVYEELVKVTQNVTMELSVPEATEEAEIPTPDDAVIFGSLILCANAVLKNLHVRGMVDVRKGHSVLEACEIHGGSDGVRVHGEAKVSISGCRIHDCTDGGDGVYLMQQSSGEISDCDIYGCRVNGVHADGASLVLRDSRIRDAAFGVFLDNSASGICQGCSIEHTSKFGLYAINGSNPTVCKNTVRECGVLCALVCKGAKGHWSDNDFDGSVHYFSSADLNFGMNKVSGRTDVEPLKESSCPVV